MKKILILAICVFSVWSNIVAQGWIGASSNNALYPVNTSLGPTPLRIGIGTSTPTEQLHTTLSVRFQGLTQVNNVQRVIVQDNNGVLYWANPSSLPTGNGNFWTLTGNTNTNPGTLSGQNYLGTTDSKRLVFGTSSLERMTIDPDGKVGIGTSIPTSSIQVVTDNGDNQVNIGGTSTSIKMFGGGIAPPLRPQTFGTPYAKIGLATRANDFVRSSVPGDLILQTINNSNSIIFSNRFEPGGNGIEQMRLTSRGFLGIGTANPTAMLTVYNGITTGTYTTAGWSSASDRRLKENISPIDNAMSIIN